MKRPRKTEKRTRGEGRFEKMQVTEDEQGFETEYRYFEQEIKSAETDGGKQSRQQEKSAASSKATAGNSGKLFPTRKVKRQLWKTPMKEKKK